MSPISWHLGETVLYNQGMPRGRGYCPLLSHHHIHTAQSKSLRARTPNHPIFRYYPISNDILMILVWRHTRLLWRLLSESYLDHGKRACGLCVLQVSISKFDGRLTS